MNFMTISEASQKWSVSPRRIQTLCATGRIVGAERLGRNWIIPKTAEKPADARVKSGKYIGFSEKYRKAKSHDSRQKQGSSKNLRGEA